jgi:hypothetical protein
MTPDKNQEPLNIGRPKLKSISDLLREGHKEPEWLVEGLLGKGTFNFLISKPKVGKTTFCESLIRAVSKGEEFLGRRVRKSSVIYLSFEAHPHYLIESLKRLGLLHDERIRLATVKDECPNLDSLREEYKMFPAGLIVIDTYGIFQRMTEINDYGKMIEVVRPYTEFARATNSTILATHHSRKGGSDDVGDTALGSTALFGTCDTFISLSKDSKGHRTIVSDQRYGERIEMSHVLWDKESGLLSLGDTASKVKSVATRQLIKDALTNQSLNQAQIKAIVKRESFVSDLAAMVAEGEVTRSGSGRKGSAYVYALADSGIASLHFPI